MEYTKEPWQAVPKKKARYWQAEVRTADTKDGSGQITAFGQLIAVFYGKNTIANAYIAAAAPELYKALKLIDAELNRIWGAPYIKGLGQFAQFQPIKQALAKAEKRE